MLAIAAFPAVPPITYLPPAKSANLARSIEGVGNFRKPLLDSQF